MSSVLDVFLHEKYVGELIQNDSGTLTFEYDESYLIQDGRQLSLSLPLREKPYQGNLVKAFFSGLLPDDIARHRLARYLGLSENNPFALLEAIGGECAGAVSLYPKNYSIPKVSSDEIEILDDHKLKEILDLLGKRPLLAGDDGIRLSLAGAQDKLAVGVYDEKIAIVKGTTPTTHIIKPMISDIRDSVHNEFFCMSLANLVGIEVPKSKIYVLDDSFYFLVERYDRIFDKNKNVMRLHQEDFCQALGILPEIKYEREGGPGISQCQDILLNNSANPAIDQIKLLRLIIFNYLIGNSDAHGKNFSLLYKNIKPNFAPAYDLLSTAVYSEASTRMAMKIGGKYKPEEVFLRHWSSLVPDTKLARNNLANTLKELANDCIENAQVLIEDLRKENIKSEIFEDIFSIIQKRSELIYRQLK